MLRSAIPREGKILFQQSCAICHPDTLAQANTPPVNARTQPRSALLGRRAGPVPEFQLLAMPSLVQRADVGYSATLDRVPDQSHRRRSPAR